MVKSQANSQNSQPDKQTTPKATQAVKNEDGYVQLPGTTALRRDN